MKILYFSRGYTPHDHRFLSAIAEGGYETFFLRQSRAASETRSLPKGARDVSGELKDVLAEVKPDLIHAGPLPGPGYLAAKCSFHPLVLMSWGSDILWDARHNPLTSRRVRYALGRANAVIGDCEAVRQAAGALGVPDGRIVIFPWGIDLEIFTPRGGDGGLRARLGWQDKFVILHMRSWEPLYDPLTVARGFVRAARRNTSLRLLMPGDGSLAAKLRRVFERAGVLDRVHLPGQISQDDLPGYYRTADAYISASQSDGSSVSLMEALASGLPALVSDIPGNREWMRSGKQGWLFPVKDETALADLMLQAAESSQREEMRAQARLVAVARADWNQNKQGLFQAYSLALEGVR
jgi:glycosyltransferase involved in cell wall biosynthesis